MEITMIFTFFTFDLFEIVHYNDVNENGRWFDKCKIHSHK